MTNSQKKPKVIVICGPTGSGKTSLAMSLVRHFPIEVISADSRQVYRLMNIGTAKATAEEQAVVRHHMIDLIDPDQEFSVAEFVDLARPLITDIASRGKIPCVVGGTGLYIRALIGGLADLPNGDNTLREQLHQKELSGGEGTLFRELQRIDPVAAESIHPNNLVRIVRALEVFELTGKRMSELKDAHQFAQKNYDVIKFAYDYPRDQLFNRINARTLQMFDEGLVAEVEMLVKKYSFSLKSLQTLGYREVLRYLKNEISAEQMVSDVQKFTRHYAKRQLTWFRTEPEIIWVDSTNESGKVIQSIDNYILR